MNHDLNYQLLLPCLIKAVTAAGYVTLSFWMEMEHGYVRK